MVLRNMVASSTAEPFAMHDISFGPRGAARETAAAAAPEPRVEVETMRAKDVRDVARDPEVAAVAPVMPIKLIAPVAMKESKAKAGKGKGKTKTAAGAAAAAGPTWGVTAVGAQTSSFTGDGVVVAVLDTGIDAGHAAFQGVTLVQQDFTGSGNGDQNGHGTHCAGTIFGRDVAGTRIGVARGVKKALIGKVLGATGGGDSDMIFKAIEWALQQGARVISMSLGFDFPGFVAAMVKAKFPADLATSVALEAYRGNLRMFDALMQMAQARAHFDGGAVIVAAAGNESRRDENKDFEIAASLPAAAQGVVSVGALQQGTGGLSIADFSNTFPQISGPGVNILSAKRGGGLVAFNGTSMACPHVAGVATLWWQAIRNSSVPPTATTVTAKLLATARTNVFKTGVDVADRGMGLATAP
jgi:subtilisin family serine protease